ncbi:hypothetical protein NA57DRAFT_76398 [Rhizodiscina lignyota]|uniref:Uncharacterized protein n=1 Tax=Rhizodiscina lignyota TaxID=1504668 RepID=A0A9P4IJ87_9PEZI|nr:hypothetical protein NA57DRAFT_76398 [Rhizodiscina lignyota]
MAAFSSNGNPSFGSLNLAPFFELPALPNIVAEWAAIIPLVCHLASYRRDYRTLGDVALLGCISLSLFPKLGTLAGLSRLLRRGPEFFDEASTRGGATCTVWDVRWGSVFPCANGAACEFVKDFFRRRRSTPAVTMPESVQEAGSKSRPMSCPIEKSPDEKGTLRTQASETLQASERARAHQEIHAGEESQEATKICTSSSSDSATRHGNCVFRRYQTLHVLRARFTTKRKRSMFDGARRTINFVGIAAMPILSILLVSVLAMCGAYGTAVIVLCSMISQIAAKNTIIRRPPGYLQSNESCEDACMLMAPHQNAQEWTLFIGDRGIVDTLLNKPMIMVQDCRANSVAAAWFTAANLLQLLAMTFVAGQKGWDGVCLVILMTAEFAFQWRTQSIRLAKAWVAEAGIDAQVNSFQFGSRMIMLGAIEKFLGCKRTVWMDQIIPPHPRREAWLCNLFEEPFDEASFIPSDIAWIKLSGALATLSANILQRTTMADEV